MVRSTGGYRHTINMKEEKGREVEVIKVGRKYITVTHDKKLKCAAVIFEIETWVEKTDYSPNHYLYESERDFQDSIKASELRSIILNIMQQNSGREFTLEQLQKVAEVLKVRRFKEGLERLQVNLSTIIV